MKRKKIALLGATGSIGTNTLKVVEKYSQFFQIVAVSAHRNVSKLFDIAYRFGAKYAVITSDEVKEIYPPEGVKVLFGRNGLLEVAALPEIDVVVVATTGTIGYFPTVEALRHGKRVALANKETLVSFGKFVMKTLASSEGELIPVDSEHSALFQLINSVNRSEIEDIILTASGGPFRTFSKEQLHHVTVEDALKHPTWSMGKKITVDSATLMNKGLEVIEAYWLFGFPPEHIKVVVHPQSVVHAMISLKDGALLAHLSLPDMKISIQYALTYPERFESPVPKLDLVHVSTLKFEPPDFDRFPALKLAYEALKIGGTMPAVMNAANEEAVHAFLHGKIKFVQIPELVAKVMELHKKDWNDSDEVEDFFEADKWAHSMAQKLISQRKI
ncbi:MAG: 1-deoxy-D-xylulose-5-phosphate reductoisomerase [Candidatus Hydrothermota bacterium]|nr:MAG: 1-deoxy-D-xylulose-5-phosphate reductoisomerase [Candidatus Hydrothermae bacterium]